MIDLTNQQVQAFPFGFVFTTFPTRVGGVFIAYISRSDLPNLITQDCSNLFPFLLCLTPLCSLAAPIPKKRKKRSHHNGVLGELFHTIDETHTVRAGNCTVPTIDGTCEEFIDGLRVCLGKRRLVWDYKYAHPAAQDPQRVDCVERLRTARNLGDGECSALRTTDRADG